EQGKADTNYSKAMTAVDEGRYEDAIEPLESLTEQIADVQTKDELLRLLADIYYSYGRFEELVTTCDRLLEIDLDGDGTLHFMKGFAEAQLGEHSSAVENLQEALDRNFGGAQYCELQLLLSATNAGMQDKAISTGEKLLTEELAVEGEIVTCYLTGLNYLQKGEPKKALPLFDRLLKISSLTDDQKAEYTYMRGVANLSAENYKEAKADFDKAIALGLDSTELHYNAAVAALALEDYEAAKKELEIAAGRKDNAELAKSAKEMLEAIKSAQ
ncbi:MAG: tetratricopeptide repeat protein, partial [Eubacteriales bacterium]